MRLRSRAVGWVCGRRIGRTEGKKEGKKGGRLGLEWCCWKKGRDRICGIGWIGWRLMRASLGYCCDGGKREVRGWPEEELE